MIAALLHQQKKKKRPIIITESKASLRTEKSQAEADFVKDIWNIGF